MEESATKRGRWAGQKSALSVPNAARAVEVTCARFATVSDLPTRRAARRHVLFCRLAACWLVLGSACQVQESTGVVRSLDAGSRSGSPAASVSRDSAATEPSYAPKRFAFCDREGADAVRDIFCARPPPTVRSLRELEDLVRVNPRPREGDAAVPVGAAVDPYSVVSVATFLAHSTALSGNLVSPINPRAILFGRYTILAFQRGVQRVERASRAGESGPFKFYLLSFAQACNDEPEGCRPGDLYTPRIEADWTQLVVQDDEDLKNTTLDCRQCHQRGRETPSLLMRELESPWALLRARPGPARAGRVSWRERPRSGAGLPARKGRRAVRGRPHRHAAQHQRPDPRDDRRERGAAAAPVRCAHHRERALALRCRWDLARDAAAKRAVGERVPGLQAR